MTETQKAKGVTDWTWVCSSAMWQSMTRSCGEGKHSVYWRAPSQGKDRHCSEDLNSPAGFREGFLMARFGTRVAGPRLSFYKVIIFKIELWLMYSVLISGVEQNDSVIHTCICMYTCGTYIHTWYVYIWYMYMICIHMAHTCIWYIYIWYIHICVYI